MSQETRERGVFKAEVVIDPAAESQLLVAWDVMISKFVEDLVTVDVWVNGQQVRRTPR